jgi:hypothetical protein
VIAPAPAVPAAAVAAVVGLAVWRPEVAEAGARAPARRRRTSLLAQIVADVATRATEQAGLSLATIPVVVGSAFGEMVTTVEMLAEREADGTISPTRFHNSVHNNSAAHLSIGHKNTAFSTSIAAGNETAAMVLLEALTWLGDRGGAVLAVVADEPLPAALGPTTTAVGAALVLAASPSDGGAGETRPALAWLSDLRQAHDPAAPSEPRPLEVPSPAAAILPLVAAIESVREPGRVAVSAGSTARWSIAVAPGAM